MAAHLPRLSVLARRVRAKVQTVMPPALPPAIELFSIAFGAPKAMHGFVLSNWSRLMNVRFRLVTDEPSRWRPLLGNNMDLIETSIDDYFRAAYPVIGVADDSDFERYRSKFMGSKNGWSACGLRPLLPLLFGISPRTTLWGWIDYDVLVNPTALFRHVAAARASVLLCPPPGQIMWEQFKLFRRDLHLADFYRDLLADDDPGSAPLEARLVYAINRLKGASLDRMEQSLLAVHWAYADHRWTIPNQFDVTISRDHRMFAPNGREIVAFVADTQVKQWDVDRVEVLERGLESHGRYRIPYERQHPAA